MKFLITLTLLLFLTTIVATVQQSLRMFHGQNAAVDQFPYLTLLSVYFPTVLKFCTGSLIDKEWILTAAHCIANNSSSPVRITAHLGSNRRYLGGITVSGTEYAIHNEYNNVTLLNDIALVKIAAINLSKLPNIKAIVLPSIFDTENYVNQTVLAAGWGLIGNYKVSKVLQWTKFFVSPIEYCRRKHHIAVPSSHMCVQPIPETSTSSICSGDSGGPLVTDTQPHQLIGVASYIANLGCELGQPMFYTNVTLALEWINYYVGRSS